MAKIRRMFTGGNTSKGFYSLHHNIISENRDKLYILKGMPGGGKSSMMKEIGETVSENGCDIEFHHCPSDPTSIDALVIDKYKIAIVDGTAPHIMDPLYPGLTDEIIDLAVNIDRKKLKGNESDIIKAKKDNKAAYRKAFSYFSAAGEIYREIELANSKLVDLEGLNREIVSLVEKVFSQDKVKTTLNDFKERHLFSTANTPSGFVDYTDSILENVGDVLYVSGQIGNGITRLMEAIVRRADLLDYHLEIFHDSMIPDNIESVYIKELDTMVTSNDNGEKHKNTIDLNRYIDLDKIEDDDYQIYGTLFRKGIESLGRAKKNHFILEKSYRPSIDYSGVDRVKKRIINEINEKIKA